MDTTLIADTRQIMRNRLHGCILPPSPSLCQHRYLCAWNSVVFTCAGFHLLMIQAVFSASGDNVLSALWEISVFWCNSLDLFRMSLLLSPSLFLSLLSSQNFSSALSFSFIPHFSLFPLPFSPIHSFSISPVFLFFCQSFPEESKKPYLSFAHSPHFRLSPPSPTPLPPSFPPSSISTPGE